MNNQKFEPKDGKILHGAGQSPQQFKKYWDIMGNKKPIIYMEYIKFDEVKEKLIEKLEKINEISGNLCLQLGLNLKPRNDKEKCFEISQGKYDDEILFLIKKLKDFKNPVFLRIGYECNDPTHNYNSKNFVLAYRYIVKKFCENNTNNVAMVWSVCTAFSRNLKDVMNYYPGDDYVDWFSDDLFGVRHFTEKNDPKIIIEKFYQESIKHKKPVMIGESSPARIGVEEGKKSWDSWFKPYFKWIHEHPNIKAFCYINWDWRKDWNQPEWGNCRIEEGNYVKNKLIIELRKKCYINIR